MISFILFLINFQIFISDNATLIKDFLPSILRILVPLSLTIYLFAYKERKEVTYSYLKTNKLNKRTLSLVITTILISLLLYVEYFITVESFLFDLILIILVIPWMVLMLSVYLYIFNSINIFYVFDKHLTLLRIDNSRIEDLLNRKKKIIEISLELNKAFPYKIAYRFHYLLDFFIKRKISLRLNSVENSIQITSHILLAKIKNNLPKDLSNNLNFIINELDNFIAITTKSNLEHIVSLNLLDEYAETYSSILRNIELLTDVCAKSSKIQELEKLISLFNKATIGPYEFTETFNEIYLSTGKIDTGQLKSLLIETQYSYIQTAKSLTYILSSNDQLDDMIILRNLKSLSSEASSSSGSFSNEEIFTLYASFLIEAVNKNNVKLLTDVVNLLLESDTFSKNETLKLFILTSIKSVELGHYKCAGHLVKMIVNNTNDDLLKNSISDIFYFFRDKQSFSGNEFTTLCSLVDQRMVKDFMISIPFSSVSFNYCFSKIIIILSLQQDYIKRDQAVSIDLEDFNLGTDIGYIYDKIRDLHKEYGLVILKNEIFSSFDNITQKI